MTKNVKRKDARGRLLERGEYQRKDGRYVYKYLVDGKYCYAYSMRLTPGDAFADGAVTTPSLREKKQQIIHDLVEGKSPHTSRMTVLDVAKQYVRLQTGVAEKTKHNQEYVLRMLEQEPFGQQRAGEVTKTDAMTWLQQMGGRYKYNTLRVFKGIMLPAFSLAVDEDVAKKNPFLFRLADVVSDDSEKRMPLTPEEEEALIAFLLSDPVTHPYADGIILLLKSGLRVSEACGLTVGDIDLERRLLHVERQLVRDRSGRYRIERTKTVNGTRVIPMTEALYAVCKRIISERTAPEEEPVIDGVSGFLFFARDGMPLVAYHWRARFATVRRRFAKLHGGKELKLTPHVCRHTFCTRMAMAGMNPKVLQYIMGHASVTVTLDTYTHVRVEEAGAEIARLERLHGKGSA